MQLFWFSVLVLVLFTFTFGNVTGNMWQVPKHLQSLALFRMAKTQKSPMMTVSSTSPSTTTTTTTTTTAATVAAAAAATTSSSSLSASASSSSSSSLKPSIAMISPSSSPTTAKNSDDNLKVNERLLEPEADDAISAAAAEVVQSILSITNNYNNNNANQNANQSEIIASANAKKTSYAADLSFDKRKLSSSPSLQLSSASAAAPAVSASASASSIQNLTMLIDNDSLIVLNASDSLTKKNPNRKSDQPHHHTQQQHHHHQQQQHQHQHQQQLQQKFEPIKNLKPLNKEDPITLADNTSFVKPTKYHYYPHNQHIYLLPECAVQQVCNAIYVRLKTIQPLCACPSRYRNPCSASYNSDDLHTTELATTYNLEAKTLVKTCEAVSEIRTCKAPEDWSILALQNIRTGKSHYLVVCRCPEKNTLEGPFPQDQTVYARMPGIRVFGMKCIQKSFYGVNKLLSRTMLGNFSNTDVFNDFSKFNVL